MPAITAEPVPLSVPVEPAKSRSFLQHAKLVGMLTLVSRFFGLGRDVVAGHYLGTHTVGTAFSMAFQVPNLFRKLFGEGALSAAFVPVYSRHLRDESAGETPAGTAASFAATTVNLLVVTLAVLTVLGEAFVGLWLWFYRAGGHGDAVLMLKLTAVMLPYVLLICTTAFLSGVLQVHRQFGPPAAAPIILNVVHILVLLVGAKLIHFSATEAGATVIAKQTHLAYWLAVFVLVAGGLQVAVLVPALRASGFYFGWFRTFWTPAVKQMLLLSMPVAIGAGVLQLSVLLDQAISFSLMQSADVGGGFRLLGRHFTYPMENGAPRRLGMAQTLYQFPLGVFAIALATAIFPGLSADALDKDRDRFRRVLRHGIEASLWEGLPASLGLILVAEPAARLMFQHGQVSGHDAGLIARSAAIYAGAIWAYSLLQIVSRAYYALHDMVTPLVMSLTNIGLNLVVEIPLLWRFGESAMAVGTLVSFCIQAAVMLWMLDRKIGSLQLQKLAPPVGKMLVATAAMGAVCFALKASRLYPPGVTRLDWLMQLVLLLGAGVAVYLAACAVMGVSMMNDLMPRQIRRR